MKRKWIWILLFSLLSHLLIFLFMARYQGWWLFDSMPASAPNEERRIVFDLKEPPPRDRELVESSDLNRLDTPLDDARLASDKNARASNQAAPADVPVSDTPYNEGVVPIKELPQTGGGQESPSGERPRQESPSGQRRQPPSRSSTTFSRELLLGQNQGRKQRENPGYDQRKSRAETSGGLQFNTYDWDFAPYLLEMKRRIQSNIYPPAAFTRLGFGGENVLRFRIYPDGRMESMETLGSKGEEALVETSRKAVTYSSPFPPLPDDFPEPFLEVTAKFHYFALQR